MIFDKILNNNTDASTSTNTSIVMKQENNNEELFFSSSKKNNNIKLTLLDKWLIRKEGWVSKNTVDTSKIENLEIDNDTIQSINRTKALKFLKLAKCQANLFSKDTTKVGCLFIDKDNFSILSVGYNGFIRNSPEPEERWIRPEKYKYVIHSELNGIINAARSGIKLDKSIVFITMFPCSDCMKALLQVGVSEIVTIIPNLEDSKWSESFKISQIMLDESNIKVMLFNKDEI